jgi:hypothetical protein
MSGTERLGAELLAVELLAAARDATQRSPKDPNAPESAPERPTTRLVRYLVPLEKGPEWR